MSLKIQSAETLPVNQRTARALQSTVLTGERLQGLAVVAQIRGVTSDQDECSTSHLYATYMQDLQIFSKACSQLNVAPIKDKRKKPEATA